MSGRDERQRDRGADLCRRYFGAGVPDEWAEVSPDLAAMTESFAFGDLWSRPGLPLRDRSMIAIAVLAALRAEHQLAWHVRGGLRAGLSEDEIRETVMAVSGLAGFPAAWTGIRVVESVLAEAGAGTEGDGDDD